MRGPAAKSWLAKCDWGSPDETLLSRIQISPPLVRQSKSRKSLRACGAFVDRFV
jgi:hypothetical protein